MNAVARRSSVGQRARLLGAVVDAVEHQVLDEDPRRRALVPGAARVEHVGERVAVVDRHQLGAQRRVGGVQRERQPHRRALARQPLDPRDPADRRDRRVRGGDAEVGQPLAGGEHGVEVHHRLAHAHEDGVVDRLDAAEVKRLVEDLRGGQVAPERIAPVAQNVQVSGQPDWLDRHSERRPSR